MSTLSFRYWITELMMYIEDLLIFSSVNGGNSGIFSFHKLPPQRFKTESQTFFGKLVPAHEVLCFCSVIGEALLHQVFRLETAVAQNSHSHCCQ